MTTEQETLLRELAAAKHRAWEHYQSLGLLNVASDPLTREEQAINYAMAGAKYEEAFAAFHRAVAAVAAVAQGQGGAA